MYCFVLTNISSPKNCIKFSPRLFVRFFMKNSYNIYFKYIRSLFYIFLLPAKRFFRGKTIFHLMLQYFKKWLLKKQFFFPATQRDLFETRDSLIL